MELLQKEREEECKGFEEACTDRFDDQIEAEKQAMEEGLDDLKKEKDEALQAIETNKTEKVWELTFPEY